MNLGQLMETYYELAGDKAVPHLASEPLVKVWANEAVTEAACRGRLLVDSSDAMCSVAVGAGGSVVTLDPRIVFVRRARLASQGCPLSPVHRGDLDRAFAGWESADPDVPVAYCPNLDTGSVRLIPPSAVADTLKLTVVREPLADMVGVDDEPEIPPRHHYALIHWMLSRGLNKQDTETYDPVRAAKHEKDFEAVFGPRLSAIEEAWVSGEQGYDTDGSF